MIRSNQTRVISAKLGERERGVSSVRLWLVPPRQVQCESRATGEAHREGALDGATGAPSPPFVLTFSPLPVLSTLSPLPLPTLSD